MFVLEHASHDKGVLEEKLTWPWHLMPPVHQRGSLLDADVTVLNEFVQMGFVVLRAVICGAIQGITNLHLLDLLHLRRGRASVKCVCGGTGMNLCVKGVLTSVFSPLW